MRLSARWPIIAILFAMCLTACASPSSASGKNNLIKMDFDLTPVVIGPADVSDLFEEVTYSITQVIMTSHSRGATVTYPTEVLPHTTAFAFGFQTRIEIFSDVDLAETSYNTLLTEQTGVNLVMNSLGDDSKAYKRDALSPEGFNLESTEYGILFRDRNAVVRIILRTDKKAASTRLGQLAGLVIKRLQP